MAQTPAVLPSHFDADVLVVGAGPSGLTLAAALAQRARGAFCLPGMPPMCTARPVGRA